MNIKYTRELIQAAADLERTWAGVCRQLGVKPSTGAQSHITRRAKQLGVDYDHFTGNLSRKGIKLGPKKPIESLLVKGQRTGSDRLKKRLIKEGLKKHQCEVCHLTEWMGEPIPIELDHIDGDHDNNLLINLAIVCPNCHAQTVTYCRKKKT